MKSRKTYLPFAIMILLIFALVSCPGDDTCDCEWSGWTVQTPATCMAKGLETRRCIRIGCGETETREIPVNPAAHEFDNWIIIEHPTETEEGLRKRECIHFAICGGYEEDILPPLGDGSSYFTISFCGNGNTSGSPPDAIPMIPGTTIYLPGPGTLQKTDYIFLGWTLERDDGFYMEEGLSIDITDDDEFKQDYIFYAWWTVPNGGGEPCFSCGGLGCTGNCEPCSFCGGLGCAGDCEPCVFCGDRGCAGDCDIGSGISTSLRNAVASARDRVFVPDIEDLLPGAAFGSDTPVQTLVSAGRDHNVFRAFNAASDDTKSVSTSDLLFHYDIDWLKRSLDGARDTITGVMGGTLYTYQMLHVGFIDDFGNVISLPLLPGPPVPDIWVQTPQHWLPGDPWLKFNIPDNDTIVMNYKTDLQRVRLTMHANGASEIYIWWDLDGSGVPADMGIYSYLKDDHFVYMSWSKNRDGSSEGYQLWEFDLINGEKTGITAGVVIKPFSHTGSNDSNRVIVHQFWGDDDYMTLHRFWGTGVDYYGSGFGGNNPSAMINHIRNNAVVDLQRTQINSPGGNSFWSNLVSIDVRALNIDEIFIPDMNFGGISRPATGFRIGDTPVNFSDNNYWYQNNVGFIMVAEDYDQDASGLIHTGKYTANFEFRSPFTGSLNNMINRCPFGLNITSVALGNINYDNELLILNGINDNGINSRFGSINFPLHHDTKDLFADFVFTQVESHNTGFEP